MNGTGKEDIAIERPFTARYVRLDISLAAQRTRPMMAVCAVQLFQQVAKTKEAARYEALLNANADAHATRFAFAQHLFAHQNHAAAIHQGLELLERTGNTGSAHEDSARALLDQIFYAVGDADDLVIKAKRHLAELDMKLAMHEAE
jgi:thioredoxin-like negative regulator of GroEL